MYKQIINMSMLDVDFGSHFTAGMAQRDSSSQAALKAFVALSLEDQASFHNNLVDLVEDLDDANTITGSNYPFSAWSQTDLANVAYLSLHGPTEQICTLFKALHDQYIADFLGL
jgi:hypothetical protein